MQQFKEAFAAADQAALERRSAAFVTELEPFKARLKGLEALHDDPRHCQAEIDRLRGDIKTLEKQSGDIGDGHAIGKLPS